MFAKLVKLKARHSKKLFQRYQLALLEQVQMPRFRIAQLHLLIIDDPERLVILCQSLVEPGRDIRFSKVGFDNKVNLLVKYRAENILVLALGRERNVIDIFARLEITGDGGVDRPVRPFWFEWFICRTALENDDVRRNRRRQVHMAKDLAKRLAKLLESRRHAANILLRCIADEQEIFCLYLYPLVLSTGRNRRKDKDRDGKCDQAEFTGGIHDLVECRPIVV